MNNELTILAFMEMDGSASYQFVSDSQDVAPINELTGKDFDAYFILIGDGEYKEAYGMYGIVPTFDKLLTKVIENGNVIVAE